MGKKAAILLAVGIVLTASDSHRTYGQLASPARGQTAFGTGGLAGRPGTGPNASAATQRGGPFGAIGQNDLFGPAGLQTLGMAGLSSFFGRGQAAPGMAPGQLGQTGFPASPFGPMGRMPMMNDRRLARPTTGPPPVRTQLRVGFDLPHVPPVAIEQRVLRTLQSARLHATGQPLQVTMELADALDTSEVIVVLRGTVATEEDRRVAAQLVLLDPGVAGVRNELQVLATRPIEPLPAPTPGGLNP